MNLETTYDEALTERESWFTIARALGNALQDAAQSMEKAAFTLPITRDEHFDLLKAAGDARKVLDDSTTD
jgi:hypothetical protein